MPNVAAHAAVGCISASAGGGDCGSGAMSAGAGAAWTNYGPQFGSFEANLISTTVVGGTASVLGGGKFANGATTAAFGYLFNYCAHNGCFDKPLTSAVAISHGGAANGAPITDVDPLTLDWSSADLQYQQDGTYRASWNNVSTESGKVYGNLDKIVVSGSRIYIPADDYDFERHDPFTAKEGFFGAIKRNMLTFVGRQMQEPGYVKFTIQFRQGVLLPKSVLDLFNSAKGGE